MFIACLKIFGARKSRSKALWRPLKSSFEHDPHTGFADLLSAEALPFRCPTYSPRANARTHNTSSLSLRSRPGSHSTTIRLFSKQLEADSSSLALQSSDQHFNARLAFTMGAYASFAKYKAKQRSEEIDRQIEEDSRKFRKECKILLLGSGESGKTTIIKQIKIVYQNGYTDAELSVVSTYTLHAVTLPVLLTLVLAHLDSFGSQSIATCWTASMLSSQPWAHWALTLKNLKIANTSTSSQPTNPNSTQNLLSLKKSALPSNRCGRCAFLWSSS